MNFRNISSWCIRNPVPPIVLFVGLLLAGLVSFMSMQVNNNPDIDFPAAQVNISQPGAAPTEMENQITQKVEAAIRGVEGVDEINSSVREGNSNTFVQFEIGTDTVLLPGTVLLGKTTIGSGCRIGPHAVLDHAEVVGSVADRERLASVELELSGEVEERLLLGAAAEDRCVPLLGGGDRRRTAGRSRLGSQRRPPAVRAPAGARGTPP